MIQDDAEEGDKWFNELLDRPWECSTLEMELKSAMQLNDVETCRKLLRKGRHWLAKFKDHEFAELMDAAIDSAAAPDLLTLLLDAGVPAHCVYDRIGDEYQHTPLVTAARRGRLDLVKWLAAAGADPLWKSPTGTHALSEILPSRAHQAPVRDTPELAQVREWLLAQGLRIDPLCADSRRKLRWAASSPASWPDVPHLLELGVPLEVTGWTPFMLDLAMGRATPAAVASLPENDLHLRDAWNRTPFLLAVTAGDLGLAKALTTRGSLFDDRGHCGVSALHLAAEHGHTALVDWLLLSGVDIDTGDDFGHSALHRAVGANHVAAAALLLQNGAAPTDRDENGFAIIHEAPLTGDLAMLKLLLAAGADVNDVSGGGDWPLKDACHAGNAGTVAFLLQSGAQVDLTSTGETALFAAVSADSIECVRLLLAAGADVNATDCDGWTCLFHLRSEEVARLLLEHGASPSVSDQCGNLPEDWPRVPLPVRQFLKTRRTAKRG
jgi:ankyrin repeat protein